MREPDEAEFAELVAARSHAMRRTAYLMCGDWHQAEDVVQTVLIKLYAAWDRVQRKDGLDAYLRRSLIRACIDLKRRKHRRETPYGELPDSAADRGQAFEDPAFEERQVLIAALAAIGPRQRAVLVLRYWEDLSVEETAGILGLAEGTVKSQASRGLAALRGVLASPALVQD